MRQISRKAEKAVGPIDWDKLNQHEFDPADVRIEDRQDDVVVYYKDGTYALLSKGEDGRLNYESDKGERSAFDDVNEAARFVALERGYLYAEHFRPEKGA